MSTNLIAGRYLPRRQLGQGAQGEVYEVLDTHEGDVVALKLLTALPAGGHWVEAQILRRLADPHILPIRNADLASGRPYLVTELAVHGGLDDRLAAAGVRGVRVDDVVRWIRQACHGIARAHDLRLVHNDIKPMNLFLNEHAECLVADFGFACQVPVGAQSARPPGATPETAAPEVAAGWNTPAATACFSSDVYSLGATAYWLLAGRTTHDFTGLADSGAKMARVAGEAPPRLRDLAPHVPRYVASAVERAMSRNPADRFGSSTEFAAALGARPSPSRRWDRTDEHASHLACWRGEPAGRGGAYLVCLEQGARATQYVITATHAASGRRVPSACRTATARTLGQAVRTVIDGLT
jgi:serine/threonine-protein kinase